MQGLEGRPPAPDIFTALGLSTDPASHPISRPEHGLSHGTTSERRDDVHVPDPEAASTFGRPSTPMHGAPAPSAVAGAPPSFSGLADLLEPGSDDDITTTEALRPSIPGRVEATAVAPEHPSPVEATRRSVTDDAVEAINDALSDLGAVEEPGAIDPTAPSVDGPDLPAFMPAPVTASPVPSSLPIAEVVEAPRGGLGAWPWILLSLMLAAGLGWVLYTQTDLFEGDVIQKRDAEALAEAEAELAAARAARQDDTEYGTVQLDSTPPGSRVWMVREGPSTRFENLPVDGEYMVAVTAPGHVPRVRVLKGTELAAPVIIDLDPVEPGAPEPELPDAPPPKVGTKTDDTATLELRSNTEGAALSLLVGYTPGVQVMNLDVSQTHRFRITAPGFETHEIVLKGRHWEESEQGLAYLEHVKLRPRAAEGSDPELVEVDDEPTAEEAATPPAVKKKRKKKKRKKRR